MLKLKHFRITKFSPTKIGTNITLELLSEDLPRDIRDELELLWKNWTSLVWIFQDVESEQKEESVASLVSKLHFTMQRYCEKEWIDFEKYNADFKKRKWFSHKNEMTREDLIREIESHKAGLL